MSFVQKFHCNPAHGTTLGNPLEEKHSAEGDWRDQATRRLPKLRKLDGIPIVGQDEEEEGEHKQTNKQTYCTCANTHTNQQSLTPKNIMYS